MGSAGCCGRCRGAATDWAAPWQFEQDRALVPLAEAAHELARRAGWPKLYDAERLAANTVPVAAAVYHDDMYVDRAMSLGPAASVRGLRAWVTNEHEHDGLRLGEVFDRLLGMARGRARPANGAGWGISGGSPRVRRGRRLG